MTEVVRSTVAALKTRPGRGGVRLSYEQAECALRLIASGARAEVELRRIRSGEAAATPLQRLLLDVARSEVSP